MTKRNRVMTTTSLQQRLSKFAEDARTAADQAPDGRQRDVLIEKARQAQTLADAAVRLKE